MKRTLAVLVAVDDFLHLDLARRATRDDRREQRHTDPDQGEDAAQVVAGVYGGRRVHPAVPGTGPLFGELT